MNNKQQKKKAKKTPFMIITSIIIAILGVTLVLVAFVEIYGMKSREEVHVVPTRNLMSELSREDFDNLLNDYYNSNDNLETDDKERQECFAVARYYQYALQFKVFSSSGDCVRASKYRSLMTKEIDNMGDLVSYKTAIEEQLCIE